MSKERLSRNEEKALLGKGFQTINKYTELKGCLEKTNFPALLQYMIRSGYQLPDQNEIPQLSEEQLKNGFQVILFSQEDQNKSDELNYELSMDYADDMYIINQNGKYFACVGTYAPLSKERGENGPVNRSKKGPEDYQKQFPDTVILGIGKYKKTNWVE